MLPETWLKRVPFPEQKPKGKNSLWGPCTPVLDLEWSGAIWEVEQ